MMVARGIEIIIFSLAVCAIGCIVLATLYDLRMIAQREAVDRILRRMSGRRQPHVTVLITQAFSALELTRCIESVHRNHYRSYDIVAIADILMSKEQRREARQLLRSYSVRLYVPRVPRSNNEMLRHAYQRSGKGKMVFCLDAAQTVSSSAIRRSVALMEIHPEAGGVQFSGYIEDITSISTLAATFVELSRQVVSKASVVLKAYRFKPGRAGMYRRSIVIASALGARSNRIAYDSETCATLPSRLGMGKISYWATGAVIGLLALAGYSIVLAATLQSTVPLLLSWSLLALWLIAGIWSTMTSSFPRKLALSLSVPIGYFVMVGVAIVQGGAFVARRLRRT